MSRCAVVLLVAASTLAACRSQHGNVSAQAEAATLAARDARFQQRLALAALAKPNEPVARWIMPRELREISGLALTGDGRLLAHDDNEGRIVVLSPRRGEVLKHFLVGSPTVHGDFEGITVAGQSIYLVTSSGVILQFEEGTNGEHVPYAVHDTRLGHECEFEGIAFDSVTASLLLPCKNVKQKKLRDQLVIYRWRVNADSSAGPRLTRMTVPLAQVVGSNAWTGLHPSDVTIDPTSGDYVLLASREKGIVEITPTGQVVRSLSLPGKHPQPEGVAITPDNILIVSDEASNHSPASITMYHWPTSATTASR